ncbi:hypothetical protein K435DRAFT_967362 [Dendrothele bispora CBS 962.96]|uniref:Uncharacterized protein n=1 Tax=Dendrothele bispora (strain CBS 962.96) TaxID=1314807 RepID=A0A4S8LV46_DENBC|nr:hypothetical protein K435DRAFT_967362 [Dendrothele bispora CBS 962.96]
MSLIELLYNLFFGKHKSNGTMSKLFKLEAFFGCLPLRLGVVALSFIIMVSASIITVTGWSQIQQLSAHPIPLSSLVALYFHSITFTVLAVLGLAGLIAGSLKPISSFLLITIVLFSFSLILSFSSGAFVLYTIFHQKSQEDIDKCLHGVENDSLTTLVCKNGIAIIKGVAVAIYLVSWAVIAYTTIVFYSYYADFKSKTPITFAMDSSTVPKDEYSDQISVTTMDFKDSSTTRSLTPNSLIPNRRPLTPGGSSHWKFPSTSSSIRTQDISNPRPLMMYNSAGAPGVNTGYAFSTVDNSFGMGEMRTEMDGSSHGAQAETLPRVTVILVVLLLITSSLASTDFQQCLRDLKAGNNGTEGGRDNRGKEVDVANATAISYDICVKVCGSGPEAFDWSAFSQEFSSWLLPWLALISQLPFGANEKLDNFISVLLAVGSPAIAAYSAMLTVLNSRWVAGLFHKSKYPNVQSAVRILSSLQQGPVRIDRSDPSLLPSLVVLPQNDQWWKGMRKRLEYTHTWTVSAATSIAWVFIAYIFTIIDSFTGSGVDKLVEVNGQGVGSVWLWLLPVVISWLQISPKCDSKRLDEAFEETNTTAFVATSNSSQPVLASSRDGHRAIYLEHGDGSLHHNERCTAPIFNYSRVFSWATVTEEVVDCFRQASKHTRDSRPVGGGKWVQDNQYDRISEANRIGTAMQVQEYCQYYPTIQREYRWGSGVWSRIFVASSMALFLQWGTTGAALVMVLTTPTKGLGCRSVAYLIYATISTLIWGLLLLSTVLAHYSGFDKAMMFMNSKSRESLRFRIAAGLSIAFRRLGTALAGFNALGILLTNIFQFSGFFDRCYCDSSVMGLGAEFAYNVIDFRPDDISALKRAWTGGVILAVGSATVFVGVLNLLINPSQPEEN